MTTLGKIYILLSLFTTAHGLLAQTNIAGTINSYAAVSAINADNCQLTVNTVSGFAAGDQAILIQMQGATFDQSNASSYGDISDISALNGAGNYEIVEIQSINGMEITLANALSQTYSPGSGRVQLVSFPEYASANVTGQLTGQTWDGTTGGVIALQVTGTLSLGAHINASRLGFRGGAVSVNGAGASGACYNQIANGPGSTPGGLPENNNYFYASTSFQGGGKGEGIGGIIVNQEAGYGKAVNGGGGGNLHNHGGGGGGHYSAGGRGGDRTSGCSILGTTGPGQGGAALGTYYTNRVFMGGGGGGGHQNNFIPPPTALPGGLGWCGSTPGGPGGGIVIIKANILTANGNRILALGDSGINYIAVEDGGGGGGAGGAVLLDVNTFSDALNVNVSGGKGSNTRNDVVGSSTRRLGPGGGGSGGVVWVKSASLPGNVTTTINGGINGVAYETVANVRTNPQARGAAAGGAGINLFNLVLPMASGDVCAAVLSLDEVQLSALASPQEVVLRWKLPAHTTYAQHHLQRALLGEPFEQVATFGAGATQYTYSDMSALPEQTLIYRVQSVLPDGSKTYSNRVQVTTQPSLASQRLWTYPNPSLGAEAITAQLDKPAYISRAQLINLQSSRIHDLQVSEEQTTHLPISVRDLPAGAYVLEVVADGKLLYTRVMLLGRGQ
ncbi:MAG: hypothetical protein KF690_02530 [Bacteroidetes bacterium]|nr:hypothetical protein [Bacteroidota bacterium]